MNNLSTVFERCRRENRAALVIFVSCGFPSLADSEALIDAAVAAGADIVELGMPFSDPIADGRVIQLASQVALRQGVTLNDVLELARNAAHRHPDTAFVLFGYFNVMLNFGVARLCDELAASGVSGILAVDLPFEERGELLGDCHRTGLSLIPLVSPETPPERARAIVADATGFVYCVSVRGVTGRRRGLPPDLGERLAGLRSISPVPVAVGFGIGDRAAAQSVAAVADGVVAGSAVLAPFLDQDDNAAAQERAVGVIRELRQGCCRGPADEHGGVGSGS